MQSHEKRETLEVTRDSGRLGLRQSIATPAPSAGGCMARAIGAALRRPPPPAGALPFDGAEQAARRLVRGAARKTATPLLRAEGRA